MARQLCHYIDYHYRRRDPQGSKIWDLTSQIISRAPAEHDTGFIEETSKVDYYSATYAVPCSADGTIDEMTKEQYEALADARFKAKHLDAVLA